MKILIMGLPGSGKTTQAKEVSRILNLCIIKTGDIVRQKALDNDRIGKQLKKALESGQLCNDQLVGDLVVEQLSHEQCKKGFVMDGYPRRISQLSIFNPEFDRVFYIDLSDQTATARMLKRRRADDTSQLIQERLRIYRDETRQVMEYYDKQKILVRIDGEKRLQEITDNILENIA